MEELRNRIHDDSSGLDYVLVGDYYIPDLKLPEESRPIGRWGRMHKAYLQEHRPGQYNELLLSGKLWTYLADLNEQAADRLAYIISQMQAAEGVTEELKARDQLAWVRAMNSIRSRAEEIIRAVRNNRFTICGTAIPTNDTGPANAVTTADKMLDKITSNTRNILILTPIFFA